MRQPWGADSLRLFADSTYLQHFATSGSDLHANGRWRLIRVDRGPFGSSILIDDGILAEDNGRGDYRIRKVQNGSIVFGLSWFWFDRSLQQGEDAPTYRRVR